MANTAARRAEVIPLPRHRGADPLPVEILESKLYRPVVRPGVVPRPELLDRLRAAREPATVAVIAPAGYGKTTLLALWAAADDRPFAWLSLDPHDNDPIVLLTHLAVAIDRVCPLPADVFDALRTAGVSVPGTVVPRLGRALSELARPLVVVLDDIHHLHDGASLDSLTSLVGNVRGTSQFALAGRSRPMALARARGQGRLLEIGVDGLAFSEDGARSLLRAAGADLPEEEAARLFRRTEGWAAGLYLAALARTGGDAAARSEPRDNADRWVAEYLRSELLSRVPRPDLDFLSRTAVLERLSGPLCDAVLAETGSAARLRSLQEQNLFLVPLDGQGQWYRYHSLFRDLLRSSLEPDDIPHLLRRAADWSESHGQLETALHYAQEAGDADRVARMVIRLTQPMYAAGRWTTLLAWFEWLDEEGAVERHPVIAAQAAYMSALTGRPAAADRWWGKAEGRDGRLRTADSDGAFASWLPTVRAALCRHGVEQMCRDAEGAGADAPGAGAVGDAEYPQRLLLAGVAHLLLGDVEAGVARLTDATELAASPLRPSVLCAALAYRAQTAVDGGHREDAEVLIARALTVVRAERFESHLTSAFVFVLAARLALHRREMTAARSYLTEAQRLRPLLTHAIPWYAVGTLLEMAECSLALGDTAGGRSFLRDAEAVLRRRPQLGVLGARARRLRGRLDTLPPTSPGASTLTSAELRLLPLLVTHLPLSGIADRLFVSRHTVKSQVWSMYRKLEVHTRSDLVVRSRELGLLDV
jgi:LuxR family maltose regulon positive regulatory protein